MNVVGAAVEPSFSRRFLYRPQKGPRVAGRRPEKKGGAGVQVIPQRLDGVRFFQMQDDTRPGRRGCCL